MGAASAVPTGPFAIGFRMVAVQYRRCGFWHAGHQWDVRPAIVLLRTVSPQRVHAVPAFP